MKEEKHTGVQKVLHGFKTVVHFLFLLAIKGSKKQPKEALRTVASNARVKHVGFLRQFLKLVYRCSKKAFSKQLPTKKLFSKKEKNTKRNYKTWARIKQDFKEYYENLKEEYAKDQVLSVSEEAIKEKNKIKMTVPIVLNSKD